MNQEQNEKMDALRKTGKDALYLMACALHGETPLWDAGADLTQLFKFCKFHCVTSVVTFALESFWEKTPPADTEVTRPWLQAKNQAIRKNVLLNAERERILSHLEEIGCWYMPLKGSLLQHDYPRFGMRQMSDNDILFDPAFRETVRQYMCSQGYEDKSPPHSSHDVYQKKPVFNYEMHISLFDLYKQDARAEYYRDVRRLLRKDPGNQYGYHLPPEGFYIYLTAHAHKHYQKAGLGIRNLMDIYVYLSAHEKELDWDYLERELTRLEAWEFEKACRRLSFTLFAQPGRNYVLSDEDRELLDVFLSSGTFGTHIRQVENRLKDMNGDGKKVGLLRYLWNRAFPPLEFMSVHYPVLRENPRLLWRMRLKRIAQALGRYPGRIWTELRSFCKLKK